MQRRHFLNQIGRGTAVIGAGAWVGPLWAAEEAVSSKHINIGCSIALTGPLGNAGTDHVTGLKAAFAAVNKTGGLFGRELRVIAKDDAYDAKRTAANVKQMIDGNEVLAFVSQIGTPNSMAAMPLLEKAGVPLVGPITGTGAIRKADSQNIFHIRPSYADEASRMIEQLNLMGLQNIAFIYLDNAFGKEVLADARRAMDAVKMKASAEIALQFNGSNAAECAQKVLDAKAGAVFLAATGTGVTDFIIAMRAKAGALPIVGMSVTYTDLARLGEKKAQGLATAVVFPSAKSTKFVLVRNYQAALVAANLKSQSGSAMESWINAQVMIEGLKRAGKDVNRDKLRAGLASIRNMEIGELKIGFSSAAPYTGTLPVKMGIFGPDMTVRV